MLPRGSTYHTSSHHVSTHDKDVGVHIVHKRQISVQRVHVILRLTWYANFPLLYAYTRVFTTTCFTLFSCEV